LLFKTSQILPQPKYKIPPHLKNGLKWKLEDHIGYRIYTKLDCRNIAQQVQQKLNRSVSESTLYRLFLWEDNQTTPYLHTLNTLSEFIGYQNWFSLADHLENLSKFQFGFGSFSQDNEHRSLLSISIELGDLRPLHVFLEQFSTQLDLDKQFLMGEEIYQSLRNNPYNNRLFFKNLSSVPIVRRCFFELLADPDFTIPNYEEGLFHYLENVKPSRSEAELQDFIFANALLFRHYYVSKQYELCAKIGKLLYEDGPLNEAEISSISIFPLIRYFAYKLFYFSLKGSFSLDYLEWLLNFARNEAAKRDVLEKRIILHTLCDALHIKPEYQEMVFADFKGLFPDVFQFFPSYMLEAPFSERLRYLESNSSRFFNGKRS
jgi:hypothetical protein